MKVLIFLSMLISIAEALLDMSGKMFVFPQESNTAHVRLTTAQEIFSAVTVCHRSFTDLKRDHSLFSLTTPSNFNEFVIYYDSLRSSVAPHIRELKIGYEGLEYAPNKWHSICTTWDSSSGLVQLWFNGQPLTKKYVAESIIMGRPIIILGQEQDSYGGDFDVKQSFVGMMSDVHVWSYVLSSCEIQKYENEQNFTPGNVLNWGALDFQINGRVLIENKQMTC